MSTDDVRFLLMKSNLFNQNKLAAATTRFLAVTYVCSQIASENNPSLDPKHAALIGLGAAVGGKITKLIAYKFFVAPHAQELKEMREGAALLPRDARTEYFQTKLRANSHLPAQIGKSCLGGLVAMAAGLGGNYAGYQLTKNEILNQETQKTAPLPQPQSYNPATTFVMSPSIP